MNHSSQSQHQEYSARYGLKNSHDNIEIAQQIAEAKYRALVGRDILFSEIININQFIKELDGLSVPENVEHKNSVIDCL